MSDGTRSWNGGVVIFPQLLEQLRAETHLWEDPRRDPSLKRPLFVPSEGRVEILFSGWRVVLRDDGTWAFSEMPGMDEALTPRSRKYDPKKRP